MKKTISRLLCFIGIHKMIATAALSASGQETVAWCTHTLKNWIGFSHLEDSLGYIFYPLWLLVPLTLLYSFYIGLYLSVIVSTVLLSIYKKHKNLPEDSSSKSWNDAQQIIAYIVGTFGKIWHGHEIIGMEHIPQGPGLIVYYHGAVVADYAVFVATLRAQGLLCYSVVDHVMRRLPGIKLFLDAIGCIDANKAECVEILKKGHLLGISPGGLREGQFSDNYELMWGNRTGFAQVALEAKVPIIPIYTQNLREGYRIIGNTRLFRWLYEHFRTFFLPAYGGFPVKLRTYVGEPIPYDPNITAAQLAEKAKNAVENLRNRHQRRPGSIMRALLERFDNHQKDN